MEHLSRLSLSNTNAISAFTLSWRATVRPALSLAEGSVAIRHTVPLRGPSTALRVNSERQSLRDFSRRSECPFDSAQDRPFTSDRFALGFGSLAARCGWAKCGLPCGPRPDTRNCSLHRGEGEREHRDRPLTRAILRRHGLTVKSGRRGAAAGPGGRRRVAGAASREG